jgi:hypothetical protein
MKAIQYRTYGGYAENKFVDLPPPAANNGQVLVRMHTVGINPLDNTFRSGHHYAATPENLPRVGGQMGAASWWRQRAPASKSVTACSSPGPALALLLTALGENWSRTPPVRTGSVSVADDAGINPGGNKCPSSESISARVIRQNSARS